MRARRRILHIVHNLDYGGLERLVGALVRLTDPAGFENHVLTLGELGRFSRGLEAFARLHRLEMLPQVSMVWPARLTRAIRAIGPDVVHTHSGVWYKASLAGRRAGVGRLVHTDHGRPYPDPLVGRLLDRLAARRTDVVVAVSDSLASQLAATVVGGGQRDRIRVVMNGVDTEHFRPQAPKRALRGELGLTDGAPVLGSVGRLVSIKAYDVMIEAFALLRSAWTDGPAPHLLLVGDGPERARLAEMIEGYGLTTAAHLVGWRRDVEDVYALLDVFTLASWSEGTSLGLLEAMSMRVCPVVTDVGGSPAVLGDVLRHRLVVPGQAGALAVAWRDALTNPDRRCQDAVAARERVTQSFGLATMVRAYEDIYERTS